LNATLTFTPLIAGYRQVSASCGVTVTDTKTNQYWTGSQNAGLLVAGWLTIAHGDSIRGAKSAALFITPHATCG